MVIRVREGATSTWSERAQLVAYSTPAPTLSPFVFLRLSPNAPCVFWKPADGNVTYAGLGAATTLTAEGGARFARIQLRLADLFQDAQYAGDAPALARPRLFGGFAFESGETDDPIWAAFPSACFLLPHFLYTQTEAGAWLTVTELVDPSLSEHDHALQRLQDEAESLLATLHSLPETAPEPTRLLTHTLLTDQPAWTAMVNTITSRIREGALQKAVLARAADLTFDAPVDQITALERLDSRYPDTYRFLVQPAAGHAFFGATPELIAEVQDGNLHTAALAGSRPRSEDAQADEALAAELLASDKERGEHGLVVAALRARIQPYARQLDVPDTPTIMRLKNIQHLYTPVSAELETHYGVLDLVNELHPTPAMGGTPSYAALRTIQDLETVSRGWYAAPIGWVDANNDGMFAVGIRSAVSNGNTARLYAGAGIVEESKPEQEWRETALKFKPLLGALGAGELSL